MITRDYECDDCVYHDRDDAEKGHWGSNSCVYYDREGHDHLKIDWTKDPKCSLYAFIKDCYDYLLFLNWDVPEKEYSNVPCRIECTVFTNTSIAISIQDNFVKGENIYVSIKCSDSGFEVYCSKEEYIYLVMLYHFMRDIWLWGEDYKEQWGNYYGY